MATKMTKTDNDAGANEAAIAEAAPAKAPRSRAKPKAEPLSGNGLPSPGTPDIAPPDGYVAGARNGTENNAAAGSSTSDGQSGGFSEAKQQREDLDIEYFRNLLLQERSRLEDERDTIRASGLDMDGALPEEGEGGDEDTADLASAMMDKEMDLAVEEELEDLMAAIDHALQKMEDGSYGICDISARPIPKGRLELIPWASLTAECQAMAEGDG
jgi:RNA polymerase-binding transcription factor DksA